MRSGNAVRHQSNLIINELLSRFLVTITLSYMIGIVIGRFWSMQSVAVFWTAGFLLALIAVCACFRAIGLYRAVLILLVAAAGGAAFYFSAQQSSYGIAKYAGSPVYVEGTIVEEPLFFDDHDSYRLSVEILETREERLSVNGTLLVKIYFDGGESYWFGERLRLLGKIVEPRGQRNPGGFDYRFYLLSQGVEGLIYPDPRNVTLLGQGDTDNLAESAFMLRSSMVQNISSALPSPSAELLTAVLFGQRHRLPEKIENNFRRAGTGHLMAVSGLHVGLVAGMILGFWNRLKLRGRLPLVIAIVFIFAYAYLTGMRPSALRAAIMASMALGAILLDRENDLPTALAFAALGTLFINPLLLFTVGFQLSYAATLSLIYAYRPLERFLSRIHCPQFLIAPLAVTIAAQAGVLPLSVYYFHCLPVAALFFNLLLLPLLAFVIGLGLAGALTGLILPAAGEILLWASRPLLELMLYITALSSAEGFYVALYPPGAAFLFAYYGLMFIVLAIYYQSDKVNCSLREDAITVYPGSGVLEFLAERRFQLRIFSGAALVLAVVLVWSGIFFPKQAPLKVTFLDVGQGAAALIEPPCGKVIMVDAGGSPAFQGDPGDVGEKIVMPYLRRSGIRSIDLAVITHPHEDHFGGFIPMLGTIPLDKVLISPIEGESEHYSSLLESAEKKGSAIHEVSSGQFWHCGEDLLLEVIGPPQKLLTGTTSDLNNNSILLILHYREIRMFFTGDIEDAAAKDLLRREVDISSDLLLVPHHGGYMEVMPAFLEAVNPSLAVIQVGPNPFGHPHPYVINALKDAGVPIYRNDYHGAVIIETDGYQIQVMTMEKPKVVNQ